MNDDLKNWDRLESGEVKLYEAIEFGVTAANPFSVVLRVDYATSQDHRERIAKQKSKPRRVQVSMSPESAAGLAELLLRYSTGLQSTVPTRDKQN